MEKKKQQTSENNRTFRKTANKNKPILIVEKKRKKNQKEMFAVFVLKFYNKFGYVLSFNRSNLVIKSSSSF